MTTTAGLLPPLGTRSARLLLATFVVVHVALAAAPGPTAPLLTIAALVAAGTAAALLVLVPPAHWRPATSAGVIVLAVAPVALVVPALPGAGWPGYASWPVGAATFIAIGLTLRPRIGAAWMLMTAVTALCVLWSVRSGEGALPGLDLVVRQIGTLVLGTLFAIGLQRTGRSLARLRSSQQRGESERHLVLTEQAARSAAAEEVLHRVGPSLELVASGLRLGDQDRETLLALEARLRDDIVLGPLRSPAFGDALATARARGVDVLLLVDPALTAAAPGALVAARDWIAAELAAVPSGETVVRAQARGGRVRVSVRCGDRAEERVLGAAD